MEFDLIDEKLYEQVMSQTVLPALEHCKREGWFNSSFSQTNQPSVSGKATETISDMGLNRLHYVCYDSAKFDDLDIPGSQGRHQGLIVISHGFTEFAAGYSEMSWYFLLAGYSVCILEHAGHGLSGRGVSDPNLVWVDSYERYVEDLAAFCAEMAASYAGDQPVCLYSHSMGAGIAASLLERHPTLVDRAVLSSPMIAPKTGVPLGIASGLLNAVCSVGLGKGKVPVHRRFNPEFDPQSVGNASFARKKWLHDLEASRLEYQTSAATYGWVNEAIRLSRSVLQPGLCGQVEASVLLFQASPDQFVLPRQQERFVKQVQAGGCHADLVRYDNAAHELYTMPNRILGPYLKRILNFYAQTDVF